jgi:hypothetical protein
MVIRRAQQMLGRVFAQRCFYLFLVLLGFDGIVQFINPGSGGRFLVATLNCLVFVCAVAAVGRTLLSFVIVSVLAFAALIFFWWALAYDDDAHLARAWGFAAALYLATIIYLLRYVFQPKVMTADKLFGAAAVYLMMGSLWATAYALTNIFYPGSFAGIGDWRHSDLADFYYFSYTVLTSTGFGDIVPKTRQARAICNVQQLTGALYVAILIARLAGVYPPMPRAGEKDAS